MAKSFRITNSDISLVIHGDRKAETTFLVTNLTSDELRGKLRIEMAKGGDANWVVLDGPMERAFAPEQTLSVRVRIAVSDDAGPVESSFQLACAAVSDPDRTACWGEPVGLSIAAPSSEVGDKLPAPIQTYRVWPLVAAACTFAIFATASFLYIRTPSPSTELPPVSPAAPSSGLDAPAEPVLRWLNKQAQEVPSDAIVVGHQEAGAVQRRICRATNPGGSILVGELSEGACKLIDGDRAVRGTDYEVLVGTPGSFRWASRTQGNVPEGAFIAGASAEGIPIYLCLQPTVQIPGALSAGVCRIAFGSFPPEAMQKLGLETIRVTSPGDFLVLVTTMGD